MRYRNKLEEMVRIGSIPGYQHMILEDGEEVYSAWGGYRDISQKQPIERDTLFLVNSSTKTLTAAAILQLSEKGQLDLDEDIREYLCGLYTVDKKITCRQLITHTGGVPNPFPFKWVHVMDDSKQFDREKFEKGVMKKSVRLVSEPGQKYLYSNPGYLLLGKIIECVSGLSFAEYFRKHFFEPLKARRDQIDFEVHEYRHKLSYGYQKLYSMRSMMLYALNHGWLVKGSMGKWLCYRHFCHNAPSYGGLYCNMDGMSTFIKDMQAKDPVLFSRETRRKMFEPYFGPRGEVFPTTHGWDHGNLEGVGFITRPGGSPGYYSNIRIYPKKRLATILLVNKTLVDAKLINRFTDEIDRELVRSFRINKN